MSPDQLSSFYAYGSRILARLPELRLLVWDTGGTRLRQGFVGQAAYATFGGALFHPAWPSVTFKVE
jgi:hypothetical protein